MKTEIHSGELTPTITHESGVFKSHGRLLPCIFDDNQDHHEFCKELKQSDDFTVTTTYSSTVEVNNSKIYLHMILDNERGKVIEYTIHLYDGMIKPLVDNMVIAIMDSPTEKGSRCHLLFIVPKNKDMMNVINMYLLSKELKNDS